MAMKGFGMTWGMSFRGGLQADVGIPIISYKQFIFKVDKVDLFGGAGDGGVEPFEIIDGEFLLPERIVDEHAAPLASL